MKRVVYSLVLFVAASLASAQEVTDEQWEAANAAIEAEATYRVFTFHDGTGEGTTKYYLTDDGWLNSDVEKAGSFIFRRVEGEGLYRSPGWQFSQYFTNPDCGGGRTENMWHFGYIRTNTNLARDDWEGQVWYKSGDTYAVRATNSNWGPESWGCSTFWTVVEDMDGDQLPNAEYSLTPLFTWRLEKIADAPEPVDPSIKDVGRLTNLPHVYINTFNGRDISSKTNYVYSRLWYVYGNDSVAYFDSLQIRGRGNATWGLAKKPYKLKFNKKAKLLGKGYANAKKWTALANHGDKTLIRNALTSLMGERLGLKNCPAHEFVDLTFNDRYDGTYQISDQVEVRPHRVKITEQDYPLTETSDITGGYLFEAISSEYNFHTPYGVPIRIHYPDEDEIDQTQLNYAQQFINNFEARLYADDFGDKDTGYRPLVDSVSLANWYLCTEISGNVDGFYSTYFYKEQQDDRIFWGPLWDYDIAYNNDNRNREGMGYNTTQQLMSDVGYDNCRRWVRRMWEDPWFARLINKRFHQVVNDGLEDYLNTQIDSLTELLDASKELNYQRWNIDQRTLRELVLYSTYDEYVSDLRNYIHDHLIYLDEAFAALSPDDPDEPDNPDEPDEPDEPDNPDEPKVPDFAADSLLYYVISNIGTDTFVDINAENDAIICNARNEESESQQWRIFPLANGYLYVVNRATGYALNDPTEGEPTATTLVGTQLNTAPGDSLDVRQQWDFVTQGEGIFNLISRFSEHAANLSGGSADNGTAVLSYTSNERNATSNNRIWRIEEAGQVTPDDPDNPDNPDEPDNPDDPDNPDEPDEPDGLFARSLDYALAYEPQSARLHFGADDLSQLTFSASVYDSRGRLLRRFRASEGTSLADLPHGLYIVTWKCQGRQRTVKLTR